MLGWLGWMPGPCLLSCRKDRLSSGAEDTDQLSPHSRCSAASWETDAHDAAHHGSCCSRAMLGSPFSIRRSSRLIRQKAKPTRALVGDTVPNAQCSIEWTCALNNIGGAPQTTMLLILPESACFTTSKRRSHLLLHPWVVSGSQGVHGQPAASVQDREGPWQSRMPVIVQHESSPSREDSWAQACTATQPLSSEQSAVHANTDHEILAPGRSIMRGSAIIFRCAMFRSTSSW